MTDQTENIYIDFCYFIRTSWHGTGTKFFPKYGFSWKWRVDRWENIPIDHRSQLQTAEQYLKRCTNYLSIRVLIVRYDHILFIRFSFWSNLVIPYFTTFLWSHCLSVYLIKYHYCKKKESLCGEVLTRIFRLPFQEKKISLLLMRLSISDARSKAITKSTPGYSCCIIPFNILLSRCSYSPENPGRIKAWLQIPRAMWQTIEKGKPRMDNLPVCGLL